MKGKKHIIAFVILALIVCFVLYFTNPELRVRMFVFTQSESLEESAPSGMSGTYANLRVQSFNSWDGEHLMTEYILFRKDGRYYGCYYSPDDVPLAFQNIDADMVQNGHAYWKWNVDDTHYGFTEKIKDGWYYFEATY